MSTSKENIVKILEKEKAKDLVFNEITKYCGMTSKDREDAFGLYKAYKGQLETQQNYAFSSKKFVGETKNAVDTMSAFLTGGMIYFEVTPEYGIYSEATLNPEELNAQEAKAEIWERLLNYVIHRLMKLKRFKKTIIKQGVLLGTSPLLILWNYEENHVATKQEEKITEENGKPLKEPKTITKEDIVSEIVKDEPKFYPINFFDYYIDPTAQDEQRSTSFAVGTEMSITDLESDDTYDQEAVKRIKEKLNDKNKNTVNFNAVSYSSSRVLNNLDYSAGAGILIENTPSDYTRVYHRFGKYWYTENGVKKYGECIITVGGESKETGELLRVIPNRCKIRPLATFKHQDPIIPGRTYGESPFYQGMVMQHLMNALVNMIVDNGMTVWQNGWKVMGDNVDENELFAVPNYLVHLEKSDDVEPMPAEDIRRGAFKLLEYADNKFQKFTGVSDALSGVTTPNTTATSSELAQSNSTVKIEDIKQNVEDFFSTIGEIVSEMIIANTDESKVIQIYNPTTKNYDKITIDDIKDIKGKYQIRVRAGSTLLIPNSVQLKMLMNAIDAFNPERGIKTFNPEAAARKWFKKAGEENPSQYFVRPQEVPSEEGPVKGPMKSTPPSGAMPSFGGLPLTAAGMTGAPSGPPTGATPPPEAVIAAKGLPGGATMPPSEQNSEANILRSINQGAR